MSTLRVGTRGSELALRQTRSVIALLRAVDSAIKIKEVIIKTHGDLATQQTIDSDWPMGGFVSAIEAALLEGALDFAVHSYKDMPTTLTPGLEIVAVPPRAAAHDVIVARCPIDLASIPAGFRIGTSSPRRRAQWRHWFKQVEIVPIRGNVPSRIAKLQSEGLDAVVLAAAGLERLGLTPSNVLSLPASQFVPAPAQGALAVQIRDDCGVRRLFEAVDHVPSRQVVRAERSFLAAIGPGCHTPVGALACFSDGGLQIHGQLFSDDGAQLVQGTARGDNPDALGSRLAHEIMRRFSEGQFEVQ